MLWTTSIVDLRNLLSDGDTDKHRYRKRVFGRLDGVNKTFKTFETRRVTNFTTSVSPLGVFVDGTIQVITADDVMVGEFTVTTAPVDGSAIEASYYYRWFTDAEIGIFLKNATQFLGLGADHTLVSDGLQPSALHFAAQEAYQKIALRWAERWSEMYLLEDAPAEGGKDVVDSYRSLAMDMQKKAVMLRDNFYTRQGQNLAPSFSTIRGNIKEVTPRR